MGQFDEARGRDRRAVAGWLFACCAVLALLVGVGGITRLTRSGLSIPNWRPVTGILPPIGEAAWKQAFAEYRETPEYRIVNPAMTLDEFRGIFAWEYVHRLLARLLGLIFAVPLAVFAWRRRLPPSAGGPLVAVLAAMALQGAMGWFLVRSGLVAEPRVSPLRLAAHLGLAFLIFGAMLWLALGIGRPRLPRSARRGSLAKWLAGAIVAAVFAQVLGGALMAGTHAGYLFPTFPRMAGELIPARLFALDPWPRSLVDDLVTIHFVHRGCGVAIAVLALGQLAASFARPASRPRHRAALAVAGAALATAGLGITTVLSGVSTVPAAAHQLSALLLFACTIVSLHVVLQGGAET
ncbi:MAG: COX15/CtaA family protein [Thermoanaerobaculia bacterium]|jgi:cytochrome c oxidase assembly protein subunit 15|nr:COX15/CtaA family protein [Thermoanaerobaculia bacterium]MBP9823232.1 COX15/CtaA family protein [Thermoanaerobaculia bacterium]